MQVVCPRRHFRTREVHTVTQVVVLGIDGQIETITGTIIHPVWSEDKQDWVPLGELSPGEQLRCLVEGSASDASYGLQSQASGLVLSVTRLNQAVPVYNIEVHGEHVYQVGELGVLVHNAGGFCGELGNAIDRGMDIIRGPGAPDEVVKVLQKMGRPMDRIQVGDVIHRIKTAPDVGLGPADDLIFDYSGGVWNSLNGQNLDTSR